MTDNTVQKFKIVLPILKTRVAIRKDENGVEKEIRYVEGVASSTDKDLHGDRMAPSAIKTMAESLKYHDVALNADHDTTWSAEIGPIVKLEVSPENDLTLEAELSEMSKANDLWYALTKNKKKLGLSIGGYVKEYEMVKEEADPDSEEESSEPHWYRLYKDIDLDHVAVTSSPANPKTWVSAISKSMDPAKDQLLMEAVIEKENQEITEKRTTDKEMKDLARKIVRQIESIEASLLLELTESVLLTLEPKTIEKIKDYVDNILEKELKSMKKKDVSLEAEESLKKDDTEAKPEGETVETPATLENESEEEAPKTEEPKTEEPAKAEEPVEEPKAEEEAEAPAEPTEEKPAEETPAEEAPSEEKPVEEKPVESEPAKVESEEEKAEPEGSSGEEGKDEEGEKPTEPAAPAEAEPEKSEEESTEKTEDKSVDNGAELLKAVQTLTDSMKVILENDKKLTDRIAELEAQPATRKTVELEKGVGDDGAEPVEEKSLKEEMEGKIAQVRKDNYGNPNLFAMTQKIRAEYSNKIAQANK